MNQAAALAQAQEILRSNDRGGYTIPTNRLYPFQWYWDSVICALGWQTFDEARAWQELQLLVDSMYDDGFLPHILFHKDSGDYFPGPEFWGTEKRTPPGSLISQPPILSMGYWQLYQASQQQQKYKEVLRRVFQPLCTHHLWWITRRQLDNLPGLVASVHPWETGMDNSPVWDEAMKAIPTYKEAYQRKDTAIINPAERPSTEQYDKFLYLTYLLKSGVRSRQIVREGPFSVYDLCIISLFHRANLDLVSIATELGEEVPAEITNFMAQTKQNISQLWLERDGNAYFSTWDTLKNQPLPQKISACFLPLYAGLASPEQAAASKQLLEKILAVVHYGVPSTAADEADYDSCRYWRGPVWLHINWMIAKGLADYGYSDLAAELKHHTHSLAERSGFCEYYDSQNGHGCGGVHFSWTAATYLIWR